MLMSRKIEALLRVAADMKRFEEGKALQQKKIITFPSDELAEDELDLISAAGKMPFPDENPWDEV